ncbi:hypothetical protein A2U01_0043821, partial [Trifolium medium]|nr:hypothetical protein [Trifolium medium]
PPAFRHAQLFDGQTEVIVPEAKKAILDDMGPEAIKNETANSSVAVFKLLDIVNYLNGREFQYLRKKDAAQKKKEFVTTLETTEAKLADVVKERDGLLQRVKELEDKILSLEGKLKSAEVTLMVEEEKEADLSGIYTESSRAELITKIFEVEYTMIEAASSQFHNAVAQLRAL